MFYFKGLPEELYRQCLRNKKNQRECTHCLALADGWMMNGEVQMKEKRICFLLVTSNIIKQIQHTLLFPGFLTSPKINLPIFSHVPSVHSSDSCQH